jgi:hypothetical protein
VKDNPKMHWKKSMKRTMVQHTKNCVGCHHSCCGNNLIPSFNLWWGEHYPQPELVVYSLLCGVELIVCTNYVFPWTHSGWIKC